MDALSKRLKDMSIVPESQNLHEREINVPFPSGAVFKKVESKDTVKKKRKKKLKSKSQSSSRSTVTKSSDPEDNMKLSNVFTKIQRGLINNVIFMTGAGISTKSGIPDFRSKETGLYANLQRFNLENAEDIFDLKYFLKNPAPFFQLAKDLYPQGKYLPNEAHFLMKIFADKGILKKVYTQNIDGLEKISGIPEDKLVECHGTFSTATCLRCNKKCSGSEIKDKILKGEIVRCHMTAKCKSVVKPDIVFFGEDLSSEFYNFKNDFEECDLLIVMGTSLQVDPFAKIVNAIPSKTPRILVNRDKVGPFLSGRRIQDFSMCGDISHLCRKILMKLGWEYQLDQMIGRQRILVKEKKRRRKKKMKD